MQQHHTSLHFPVVLAFAFIFLGLPAYMSLNAQVACPAGYTCIPNNTAPTASNPCYTFTSTLSNGSRGEAVSRLQAILIANGFDIPNISSGRIQPGSFSNNTGRALRAFQQAKGLDMTGYLDVATREVINAMCPGSSTASRVTTPVEPVSSRVTYPTSQACGGAAPTATGVLKGGGLYTTGHGTTRWTFVTGTPGACQWTCTQGYGLHNGTCAETGTFTPTMPTYQACGGTEPTVSEYVTKGIGRYTIGYGTDQWTFVTVNPGACQYSCRNSGIFNGNTCVSPTESSTNTIPALTIRVLPNAIYYQAKELTSPRNQSIRVSVTNGGSKTWGASHDLAILKEGVAIQMINMATTAPGEGRVISFDPVSVAGRYTVRALEQNVEWFGDTVTVIVQ